MQKCRSIRCADEVGCEGERTNDDRRTGNRDPNGKRKLGVLRFFVLMIIVWLCFEQSILRVEWGELRR